MPKIGIDIVAVSRMEKQMQNTHFLHRVFTEKELAHGKTAESLAGIFAAKEAYFKAVGSGIKLPLTALEVLHRESGRPYFNDKPNTDLYISHDGGLAVAAVIVEE